MKKKLLIALVVVSMLICVLAACGEDPCTHNWVDGDTTATCEAAGTTPMTCSLCGATSEKAAAALGHEWERTETVKASCIAGGYDLYECTRCDASEQRNQTNIDFSPAGHDYLPEEKKPTCTTSGYTDNTCTLCGAGDGNRETLKPLGHTYEREGFDGVTGVDINEPKCVENGSIIYTCTEEGCGFSVEYTYEQLLENGETELAATLQAIGHNFSVLAEHVDPVCLVGGYTINSCANNCGETYEIASTEALGHTYQRSNVVEADYNYAVVLDPTCITEGYEWVICDDCEYCTADDETPNVDAYRQAIAPTGEHVYDVQKEIVAPLCLVDGYTIWGCSVDGACVATENRDFVTQIGHNDLVLTESLLTNGEPTCKTNGDYPYHCVRCDYTTVNFNGEENNGARHEGYTMGDFSHAQSVEPTCISRGKYYCANCETVFNAYAEDTAANAHGNHVYSITGDTTAPICSEYGYTTYHCSADATCVETQRRDYVARAGHTFTAPTEDGTIVCEVCSAKYINETTVIYTENQKLCTHADGETCETCGIGVIITGTKTPDAPKALTAGAADITTFDKGAALIELKGESGTTYEIKVFNKLGQVIATYDVIDDGTDIGKINVVTGATGSCVVDITEIEGEVGSISIKASTAATVSYYVTVK